jgi:quercetin dioxygenase-like cupin family protein
VGSDGAYVLEPGSAELRWMGATSTQFLATDQLTAGKFAMIDERSPRGVGAPLHAHSADVESFYVLEGELSFFIGNAPPHRGGPGTFVHVPAGAVHGFRIESEAARYLILTTVHHGEFYRAITLPSREGGLPPLEKIDGETVGRACREFGVEFVGPLP